jgi:hypothetical protein
MGQELSIDGFQFTSIRFRVMAKYRPDTIRHILIRKGHVQIRSSLPVLEKETCFSSIQ